MTWQGRSSMTVFSSKFKKKTISQCDLLQYSDQSKLLEFNYYQQKPLGSGFGELKIKKSVFSGTRQCTLTQAANKIALLADCLYTPVYALCDASYTCFKTSQNFKQKTKQKVFRKNCFEKGVSGINQKNQLCPQNPPKIVLLSCFFQFFFRDFFTFEKEATISQI